MDSDFSASVEVGGRSTLPGDGHRARSRVHNRKDSGELADLYQRYWRAKAEVVFEAMGIHPNDREDLAQDCFLSFFQNRDFARDPDKYFMQAVRAICIDRLRARSRRQMVRLDEIPEIGAGDSDPGLRIDLERLLNRLKSGERRILLAHACDGASHAELAEAHGIRPASMRKRVYRLLLWLRRRSSELLRDRLTLPRDDGG